MNNNYNMNHFNTTTFPNNVQNYRNRYKNKIFSSYLSNNTENTLQENGGKNLMLEMEGCCSRY